MTGLISGGVVSVEDGIKKSEEFAPARKVRVELRFDVAPDNPDEVSRLYQVSMLADQQVRALLGFKPAVTSEKIIDQVAVEVDKKKPGRKPKTEPLPAVETFPGSPDGGQATKADGTAPSSETQAANDFSDDPVPPAAKAAEEAPAVMSDKVLYDKVMEINARIKQGAAITQLAAKYCPNDGVPPSLKRIAEDKRGLFLEEVIKLAAGHGK